VVRDPIGFRLRRIARRRHRQVAPRAGSGVALLHDMRELVGQQTLSGDGIWVELAGAKHDVRANCIGAGSNRSN
jgi:hypothetical protein